MWHKEILHALALGIRVYGGSSMGALRAAELHPFGMRGVGRIFGDFASGVLEDDDEVALIHGPADTAYACQSEAMANIRCALEEAVLA
ncbi:TfuA domain-containing protein [Massilia sp. H-1]|nr:TfuA domain-containing protein [Massilia sp. H-1]